MEVVGMVEVVLSVELTVEAWMEVEAMEMEAMEVVAPVGGASGGVHKEGQQVEGVVWTANSPVGEEAAQVGVKMVEAGKEMELLAVEMQEVEAAAAGVTVAGAVELEV